MWSTAIGNRGMLGFPQWGATRSVSKKMRHRDASGNFPASHVWLPQGKPLLRLESTETGGIFGGVPLEFYDMSFICKQAISKPTVSLYFSLVWLNLFVSRILTHTQISSHIPLCLKMELITIFQIIALQF